MTGIETAVIVGLVVKAAISVAISIALNVVASAILPKPKAKSGGLAEQGRQDMLKQPIGARRTIYGQALVSGTIVYFESYGAANKYLSMVLALAGHECESFDRYYLDDVVTAFDSGTGATTNIRWIVQGVPEGVTAWMYPHLGASDQSADANLMANSAGKWTAAHRLRGIAYVHFKALYSQPIYPDGLPKVRVLVMGKQLYDPRTATTVGSPGSENPALVLRDYLASKLGVTDAEIDDATVIAAANICDEDVPRLGDSPERRYRLGGIVDDGQRPGDVIDGILSAMAGTLVHTGGRFEIHAGAAGTASVQLDEDDLAGPIEVAPRLSRSQIFNAVKAVFVDPTPDWQPTTAPAVTNATYEAQDGGQRIWKTLELPFTNSPTMAQRLAKIELERVRQQIVAKALFKPSFLLNKVWDVVGLTNERFGWTQKDFRIVSMQIEADGSVFAVLKEEAASMWSWSLEETVTDPAPDTNLPNPWALGAPTGLTLASGTDQLYLRGDGTVQTRLRATWDDPLDGFVVSHEAQIKVSAGSSWVDGPRAAGDARLLYFTDAQDGVAHDVRVRAVNALGVRSPYATVSGHVVIGKTERPPDVPTLYREGDLIRWAYPSPPLDFSGFRVRHHSGINRFWSTGRNLHDGVVTQTQFDISGVVGLGTIMVMALDTSGNESLNAAVLIADIGDPLVENVVETIDHRVLGWPGEATAGAVVSGDLVADDSGALFWSAVAAAPFWSANPLSVFWTDTYLAMIYVVAYIPAASFLPCQLTLSTGIAAESWTIEYRRDPQVLFWEDDVAPFWSADVDAFWEALGAFTAWPGALPLIDRFQIEFRVSTAAGRVRGVLSQFQIIADVEDIVERLDDVVLAPGGTALPVTQSYRVIRNVLLTLQDDGGTAETIKVLDKAVGGPTVRAFNAAGTGVAATVDATIQGY